MGGNAWTYREGRSRDLYVVEFSHSFMIGHHLRTRADRIEYARGYFDAEGGVPMHPSSEPYLHFAQKNREDLTELHGILTRLGLACGRIHSPSHGADPDYWRFYLSRNSIGRFAELIGSWHPRKAPRLRRMAERRRATRRRTISRPTPPTGAKAR